MSGWIQAVMQQNTIVANVEDKNASKVSGHVVKANKKCLETPTWHQLLGMMI